MSNPNVKARLHGSSVEHRLAEPNGTMTRCGKDATLMNRYPFLTQKNSNDRRVYRRCVKCGW